MEISSASNIPPVAGAALLEARGLCKFYAEREVLHEVNFAISPREIVTIVGPNGAGKTTLLNCLLGLDTADYGTITRAPNVSIGYVPQHFRPQASLPMDVASFLKLYAPLDNQLIETLSITPLLKQPLANLSGGELRRVLLARALLGKPNLLVLDEPTAGVDVGGQGELYRLLKRLSTELDFAVLMVSHDLYVVMASTERVICLNHHVCCEGTPQHVGGNASFRAMFGDALADQIALYHHHHTHSHGLGDEDYPHTHHYPHGQHHG
ncbi:MAG: ATP-binding cassette domain-containing protein [Rickettsiales bacterium]